MAKSFGNSACEPPHATSPTDAVWGAQTTCHGALQLSAAAGSTCRCTALARRVQPNATCVHGPRLLRQGVKTWRSGTSDLQPKDFLIIAGRRLCEKEGNLRPEAGAPSAQAGGGLPLPSGRTTAPSANAPEVATAMRERSLLADRSRTWRPEHPTAEGYRGPTLLCERRPLPKRRAHPKTLAAGRLPRPNTPEPLGDHLERARNMDRSRLLAHKR